MTNTSGKYKRTQQGYMLPISLPLTSWPAGVHRLIQSLGEYLHTKKQIPPNREREANHKGVYIWALIFWRRENFPEKTFLLGICQLGRGNLCLYWLMDLFFWEVFLKEVFFTFGDISCIILPHFLEPFHNNREKCPFHLSTLQQPMS